jgi:protein ImuB
VAAALLQFTPLVVIAEENVVLADVTASLRLFGGLRALRRSIRRVVADFGVTSSMAVAATAQAAWLFARTCAGVVLSDRAQGRAPPCRWWPCRPRRYADWFDGLGCTTMADVMRLPRAA